MQIDDELTADRAETRKLAGYVRANVETILTALYNQAHRFTEAATEAQQRYDQGRTDPDTRAAQDRSLMTNNGYRQAAVMFTQQAEQMRTVAQRLGALTSPREGES